MNNSNEQYERDGFYDITRPYPANYFRTQQLLKTFAEQGIHRVVEIGTGQGRALIDLAKSGIDVWGFDLSEEMVKTSQDKMRQNDLNPDHICWGDIRDATTYKPITQKAPFDGLMAMGIMPNVEDEDQVLDNMSQLLKPGSRVFIEYRNKMFSLFTMNRYTYEFILDDILQDVDPKMKTIVADELKSRLAVDIPPKPAPDAPISKFHNPFEVVEFFEKKQFTDIKLLWYHYHPALPMLEKQDATLFRREAVHLENESSNWRGLFLCSAFIIQAVKA